MPDPATYADVILPLPVPGPFTYRIPETLSAQVIPRVRVVVQFGPRKIYTALVRSVHNRAPSGFQEKEVLSVLDERPVVTEQQVSFWDWMADYYLCTAGEVMQAALPSAFRLASETKIALDPGYTGGVAGLNEREIQLLEALSYQETIDIGKVSAIIGLKKVIHIVKGMIEKGIVLLEEDIRDKYRPRKEKMISLPEEFRNDDEKLSGIFDSLERRAKKQLEVLMAFIHLTHQDRTVDGMVLRSRLIQLVPGSTAALEQLIKKEILVVTEKEIHPEATLPQLHPDEIILSAAQENALSAIRSSLETKPAVLLHGVTSSGKTEIYIKLIQQTIEQGRQALYLLPEIALTTQIISRLTKYFGSRIGIYHSRLNDNERIQVWNGALDGRFDVILGARSAIFLPLLNPGLVIVDEEHDYSYKQIDPAPRYHARDAALYLASACHAKAILGSATPSIETYYHAKQEKFGLVELFERYGELLMPSVEVVDLKQEHRKGTMRSHFSSVLVTHLEDALKNHEQAILFQNRRGFSLRLECDACHWMPVCKNCDVTLVYHKQVNRLRCHYCGYVHSIPEHCPECGNSSLKMKGFGTEKVEEELQILLPRSTIMRMDLDTTRSKNAHQRIISDFEEGKIDFLVGTQMVTKGLDFDHVSTVGILNADNMLSYPDFRAAERSYQLMAQVSGRAGRKKRQGRVVIQTWQPKHPIILNVVANDYGSMYLLQLNERNKFRYPPFCRLIVLRLKHRDPQLLNRGSERLAASLRTVFGDHLLGPEYPVVGKIMNYYIKQILVKVERGTSLALMKEKMMEKIRKFSKNPDFSAIRVIIDVDPV